MMGLVEGLLGAKERVDAADDVGRAGNLSPTSILWKMTRRVAGVLLSFGVNFQVQQRTGQEGMPQMMSVHTIKKATALSMPFCWVPNL